MKERPGVLDVWEPSSHWLALGINQSHRAKDCQGTIGTCPVCGRADTAPGDNFGLHFDSPQTIRKEEKILAKELSGGGMFEIVEVR